MGIKHFFYWFKRNFESEVYPLQSTSTLNDVDVEVDNFLIDMNGIFHNSAQRIYEYGNHKKPHKILPRVNKEFNKKKEVCLFEDVCKTVELIFNIVNPRKRFILCVDGPAPASKLSQQRQRRFRSAIEMTENTPFNSNCITPGTIFMENLHKYIDWYITKRINESKKWRDIEVVYSSQAVPGEGEQKAIQYIRKYGLNKESYCIHGLDADIIMLALGTHKEKFYILREELYDNNIDFLCVNVGNARDKISELMRWDSSSDYTFDKRIAINDFIFLCFMVGNDFLPHIPSIEIIEDGIELIFEIYKNVGEKYGHITELLEGDIKFIPHSLSKYLEIIGDYEENNFTIKAGKKGSYFPDILIETCTDESGEHITFDIEKYKELYMKTHFNIDTEVLCHQYLEGMQWVITYYTKEVPNWKWYFPHHYAPPASILCQHCKTFKFPKYSMTKPSSPFVQLLSVLPPSSSYLIPKPLSNLLSGNLQQFCPEEINVDLSGVRREWEGKVLLPMIDLDLVKSECLKIIKKVSKKDLSRNREGKTFLYKHTPYFTTDIKSYYGDINNCRVKKSTIQL